MGCVSGCLLLPSSRALPPRRQCRFVTRRCLNPHSVMQPIHACPPPPCCQEFMPRTRFPFRAYSLGPPSAKRQGSFAMTLQIQKKRKTHHQFSTSLKVRQSRILGPPSAKRQGSFAMTLQIQKTHHQFSISQKVRQSRILGPPSAKRQGSFAMTLRFQNHTSSFIILFYYYYYYY